jgi:hypothetical protein
VKILFYFFPNKMDPNVIQAKSQDLTLIPGLFTANINFCKQSENQSLIDFEVEQAKNLAEFKIDNKLNHAQLCHKYETLIREWYQAISKFQMDKTLGREDSLILNRKFTNRQEYQADKFYRHTFMPTMEKYIKSELLSYELVTGVNDLGNYVVGYTIR